MPSDTVLTPEGLEELKAKIEHLRGDRRREVAERIKEAREFGDIAENSEYDDAKNEQAMLEKQISDLEEKLRNARVIDEKDVDTASSASARPSTSRTRRPTSRRSSRSSAPPRRTPPRARLSNESPVGRALLGHKRGDTVTVPVPRGPARKLKITKIERR